jgi:hypothetical protein
VTEKSAEKTKDKKEKTGKAEKSEKNNVHAQESGSGPPDDSLEPLEGGWPDGWLKKKLVRQSGATKGEFDTYWFSPKENIKFRSMKQVKLFIAALKETDNDETKARKQAHNWAKAMKENKDEVPTHIQDLFRPVKNVKNYKKADGKKPGLKKKTNDVGGKAVPTSSSAKDGNKAALPTTVSDNDTKESQDVVKGDNKRKNDNKKDAESGQATKKSKTPTISRAPKSSLHNKVDDDDVDEDNLPLTQLYARHQKLKAGNK